jgi:hypothetical protein
LVGTQTIIIVSVIASVAIAFPIVVMQMNKLFPDPSEISGFRTDDPSFVAANSTGEGYFLATLKEGQKTNMIRLLFVDESNQIPQFYKTQIDGRGGIT